MCELGLKIFRKLPRCLLFLAGRFACSLELSLHSLRCSVTFPLHRVPLLCLLLCTLLCGKSGVSQLSFECLNGQVSSLALRLLVVLAFPLHLLLRLGLLFCTLARCL